MKINIQDKSLFGNDAADDENEGIFESYAVERAEVDDLSQKDALIKVVRAYKGEGKSALLRLVSLKLKKSKNPPLLITISASAISPSIQGTDSDQWVKAWKIAIVKHAAGEIGSKISVAYSDDAISLVEEAEANNFKQRSFVSSIADRLQSQHLKRERLPPLDSGKVLARWLKDGELIWFVIDDVDQNFENTDLYRVKIASFFTAIRQVVNQIPEFRFRTAIRPNVWTAIKRDYEALSHIEQYIIDLAWSRDDYWLLLSRRIEGYLRRTEQWEKSVAKLSADIQTRNRQLIAEVFDDPMPWGLDKKRPPALILHTLSRQRPRWLVELCRVAASDAVKMQREKIGFTNLENQLEAFGKRRLEDTIAEFKSQCAQIADLIVAFKDQPEWFSTADLNTTIKNRIMQGTNLTISGVIGRPTSLEIAHFLYQIGFLTARKDNSNETYSHVSFSENPDLLSSKVNLDQGYSWEIHPVFRQALKLKNVKQTNRK